MTTTQPISPLKTHYEINEITNCWGEDTDGSMGDAIDDYIFSNMGKKIFSTKEEIFDAVDEAVIAICKRDNWTSIPEGFSADIICKDEDGDTIEEDEEAIS